MFHYMLYMLGLRLSQAFPRSFLLKVASLIARVYGLFVPGDSAAIKKNLQAITGKEDIPPALVRDVYRHFACYMVDFFRSTLYTPQRLHEFIEIEGVEHLRNAIGKGKGVIGLSAHMGNYELAAAALGMLGQDVHAVVYQHQHPKVDAFFREQRAQVGIRCISLHHTASQRVFYQAATQVLKCNGMLGFVGDRDFFHSSDEIDFFGHPTRIPSGPASFSVRSGAPIVPCFMIRKENNDYKLRIERPIEIPEHLSREDAVRQMTREVADRMMAAIAEHPTQWYVFQEFWKPVSTVVH